tara:strand:+ start:207 stop:392 length:186 start_codon:yes stop_codon:yes gene_type:complete
MVRPSRKEKYIGIKTYYRDRKGVMREIKNLKMIIHSGSAGVIVYTNPNGSVSSSIDLREKY